MRLNEIYRRYRKDVDFYCVYILEAHPEDGWQVPDNVEDGAVYDQPTTGDERAEIASTCMLRLNLEMPMLLDTMHNETEEKYVAQPERLFLLDRSGAIAWSCGIGPWGFDPDGWEEAIKVQLASAP